MSIASGYLAGAERSIPLLLAKWEAHSGMRATLGQAARAHLAGKMPADNVEALLEQQIATEQATYLVEFFWLLGVAGCAAPERMEAWIDRHNALTARMWAEVLLEKAGKTADRLMADGRSLQRQQTELIAELLGCLGKARRRMATDAKCGEPAAAECLQSLDTVERLLRDLAASKQGDACPRPQHGARLTELETPRRLCAPPGPRCRRRLERLLEQAYFGAQARNACCARLDGTRVVLCSSDLERFMALRMDPKLCRERLDALAEADLLEDELRSDDWCPAVRLFRPTERLEAAIMAGLEPLRALLRADAVFGGDGHGPSAWCMAVPFHDCHHRGQRGEIPV